MCDILGSLSSAYAGTPLVPSQLVPIPESRQYPVIGPWMGTARELTWEICTPLAPVPMTAQRLPRTSTPSGGQKEEWYLRLNISIFPTDWMFYIGSSHCPLEVLKSLEIWNVPLRSKARGHNEELGFGSPAICSVNRPFTFFLLRRILRSIGARVTVTDLRVHLRRTEHQ